MLFISETFLNSKINDNDIIIEHFNVIRQDRNNDKAGGGLIAHFRKDLNIKRVDEFPKFFGCIESLWLKLIYPLSTPIFICGLYRPPNTTTADLYDFHTFLRNFNLEQEIILCGDMNFDLLRNDGRNKLKLMSDIGFEQLISGLCRITEKSSSLIYHIFVNYPNKISDKGVLECSFSDHDFVHDFLIMIMIS